MRHPTVAALLEAAASVLLGSVWLLWTDALPLRAWPLLVVLAMMAVVVALKARSRHKHPSVQ
jgi:hypothetical protein